jgi:von Willebrand factor type A domain
MSQTLTSKKNKILIFSIFISLMVHGLFLHFVQTHSLWFCSSVEKTNLTLQRQLTTVCQDQILKETFASNLGSTSTPTDERLPKPQYHQLNPSFQASLKPVAHTPIIISPNPTPPLFSLPELPVDTLFCAQPLWTYAASKMEPSIHDFLKGMILPSLEPIQNVTSSDTSKFLPLQSESLSSQTLQSSPLKPLQETILDPMILLAKKDSFAPRDDEKLSIGTIASLPLPQLPLFLSLANLDTINLSDAFNAELTFLPKIEGSGYLFALTLIPREDLHLPKIQQRLTFLIDRGNSIQRERLLASKQAVLRALEELDLEDSFNIIVFDSKTDKLFSSFSLATPAALNKAEEFLNKMDLGSFFATSDPYRPLLHTIPSQVQEEEIHTVILLTDGETLSSKSTRQALLQDWTIQNQGKVSLYIVGLDTDPNPHALEALCTLNRGRYIPASSQRGLKRQILKLAKNIKTPLAKNLSANIICRTSKHPSEIYPQTTLAPHLYQDQPYVIVGSTETLDDFIIFIQGRLRNQWLNVKKTLSFVNAKKGTPSLKTAFHQYEKLDLKSMQSTSLQ